MKKMIMTGVLSVVALTLTHCTKHEESVIAPANGAKFALQAEVAEGRTAAEGMTTTWVADDAMKVWIGAEGEYTNCGEFTITAENLGNKLFTGTMPDNYNAAVSYDWYALYPYETANYEVEGTPAQTTMMIGTNIQRQTGGYSSIAHISGSVAPLYGVAKGVEAGTQPRLQMKHLSTLVKIVVENQDEEALEVGKIAIESEDTAITGRARICITGDAVTYEPIANAANQALLRVTSNEETIAQNGKAEFYMALIPFTAPAAGEKLRISVIATNGDICTRTFTIPAGTTFKAGEMNTFTVKYSGVESVDLSANGTANCYIVTSEGNYKFKATQGNSDTCPEISTADWLWMSESNDLISNVRYVDGYVYFTAGSKKGNALVAGFTAKEVISWSWHIWLTNMPTLHYGATTNQQIMDRNLGATSTTVDDYKSYGLYYQWGRKDPFPGPNTANAATAEGTAFDSETGSTVAYVVNPAVDRVFNSTRNTNITGGEEVAWSLTSPMCYLRYYNADNGGGVSNWWNSAYADFTNLWGFVAEGQQVNKTIYDPCPAGYAVPAYLDDVYGSYENLTTTFTPIGTLAGRQYTGAEGSTSYYPAAGYRDRGAPLGNVGAIGQYWTAYPRAKSTDFRTLKFSTSAVESSRTNSAYGNSVRCVKINN